MGGAGSHAGRQIAGSHPVFAAIAFEGFTGGGIELWHPPRARRDAGPASDAFFGFNRHQTILWTLADGMRGAYRNTPRIFTVKASSEGRCSSILTKSRRLLFVQQNAKPHIRDQGMAGLAVQLASMTGDAAFGFMADTVLAHDRDSSCFAFPRRET
jgi:hypothetical protein